MVDLVMFSYLKEEILFTIYWSKVQVQLTTRFLREVRSSILQSQGLLIGNFVFVK